MSNLEVPILFLVFNRPETTLKVFKEIRKSAPLRLYIACDGARNEIENNLVDQVKEVVSKVDWDCQVKTLFRDENLGCKSAVSGAIDWFFDNEAMGIILEDDCVPSQSFFPFCASMLKKYQYDQRVWMISGFNPRYPGTVSSEYYFSENPSVWGWASWADRWCSYDVNMSSFPSSNIGEYLDYKFPRYVANYYKSVFASTHEGRVNTWDYQWTYALIVNNGLTVKPLANLISNIGVQGAHANKRDKNHFLQLGSFDQANPEERLVYVRPNLAEDEWFYQSRLMRSKRVKLFHWLKSAFSLNFFRM